MTTTAQQLIDRSSGKHWSFDQQFNDGLALAFLDEKQKSFILDLAKTIESLIGTTEEILTALDGAAVVAVDSLGVPYFTDTITPGYAIRFSGGVPYVAMTNPIIVDPFGKDGDTPGLPLPENLLRLIFVCARTQINPAPAPPIPVEIVTQETVRKAAPRTGLQAFMSANRLIPVRMADADQWTQVQSIQISCIICPSLTALTDELSVPDTMLGALSSSIAEWMAMQSPKCPASDRQYFARKAEKDYNDMMLSVNAMDAVTTSSVIYRRG